MHAIPIFTSQLEKSREAVDLANLRAAYAECSAALLSRGDPGNGVDFNNNKGVITCNKYVTLKQKQNNWQSGAPEIGGVKLKKPSTVPNQYWLLSQNLRKSLHQIFFREQTA